MIRLLKNTALFFLLFTGVAFLADLFLSQSLKKSEQVLFKVWNDIAQDSVQSDLVIYGSSRARKQINPKVVERILKMPTYNLGLDGQTVILQKALHQEFIKYNRKPKYILFVVDQFTIAQDNNLFNSDQLLPYFTNANLVSAAQYYETFSWFDYNLPLVRYAGRRAVLREAAMSAFGKSTLSKKQYKGFTFNTGKIIVQGAGNIINNDSVKVNQQLTQMFEEMVASITSDSINLVFIIPPMHHKHYNMYVFHNEFMEYIQKVAKNYDVPLLNYHQHTITTIDSLFRDPQHVNLEGADVFTEIVAQDIQKIYPNL